MSYAPQQEAVPESLHMIVPLAGLRVSLVAEPRVIRISRGRPGQGVSDNGSSDRVSVDMVRVCHTAPRKRELKKTPTFMLRRA
jgi:hypothetical protein